jgi:2-methylaconitate cis-trans-isomerase PrpF
MSGSRGRHVSLPAVFMRGGTSKAVFFRQEDLPKAAPPRDCSNWDAIFCGVLGSPDPNGRQLDGMGGGLSSLSKIAVIGKPTHPDADVDFSFAQVAIREAIVSYRGTCGNISSAVGPYAVDEGLVKQTGDSATVRIHNTNTGKIVVATFALQDGKAAVGGEQSIAGVAGEGDPVRLAFLDPGGATTGKLLPTGNARDQLDVAGLGRIEASLVDAANPVVFVRGSAFALDPRSRPEDLERDAELMKRLEELRVVSAVRMGLCSEQEARTSIKNLPLVSLIWPRSVESADADIVTRMVSAGQPHRATPLTGAMCLAVAGRLPGSVVAEALGERSEPDRDIAIAHASGILTLGAKVRTSGGETVAEEVVVYRTARRLMEGRVFYRTG